MNAALVVALQTGIPAVQRPFAAIGSAVGMTEAAVLAEVREMFANGSARRLGAVFDARRLGYQSTLCALKLPASELDAVAALITPHTGVTHCYVRGWPAELDPGLPGGPGIEPMPNLWFTLAEQADRFADACAALSRAVAPHALIELPACRRFKIDVIFNPASRDRSEQVLQSGLSDSSDKSDRSDTSDASDFSGKEKELIRRLQGSLPLDAAPFAAIARELAWDESSLLAVLDRWIECGIIRRVALVVRHQALGFKANGMCVWRVAEEAVGAAGRSLAAHPAVTHCYARVPHQAFLYNMFAMIHSGTWPATRALFDEVGSRAGLSGGRLLCSLHEYKKTSPVYFGAGPEE